MYVCAIDAGSIEG